jgi:hypothetical protein
MIVKDIHFLYRKLYRFPGRYSIEKYYIVDLGFLPYQYGITFTGVNKTTCILYVPRGSLEAYWLATNKEIKLEIMYS